MPYNPYANYGVSSSGSALRSFAITPHDTNDLPAVVRGVIVGGAGTIRWRSIDGTINNTAALPAGFLLPIQSDRILATGTTGLV